MIEDIKLTDKDYYQGIQGLKGVNTDSMMTPEMIEEYIKCSLDPLYFIEHYLIIVTPDGDEVPFKLYDYQKDMLDKIEHNRLNIYLCCRQAGKSQFLCGYVLWNILFKRNFKVKWLANKLDTAMEMIERIKFSYIRLPLWLQKSVKEFNKSSMTLENGSKVSCVSTTMNSGRGSSVSLLLCVDGNNYITIRNKKTGVIEKVKISKLYQRLKHNIINEIYCIINSEIKFLENIEYEILTPQGWCDFDGIQLNGVKDCIKIKTNTKEISCTPDHKIVNNGTPIEAEKLNIGDNLNGESIIDIVDNGKNTVYDIINTGEHHTFLCNDIPVKNCDEFAFVDRQIQDAFLASAFPTILSGKKTKLCIISTPNGQEKFYELFTSAQKGMNDFAWIFVDWTQVPGRDEKWKKMAIDVNGLAKFRVEHECKFEDSTSTLISKELLDAAYFPINEENINYQVINLNPDNPKDTYKIFHSYDPDMKYYIEIDPSEGIRLDYTVINVLGNKNGKWIQCALWHCNSMNNNKTLDWIIKIANDYNNPVIGVESNSIGKALVERLYYEREYENVLITKYNNKSQKYELYSGGLLSGANLGIRTTNHVKITGGDLLRNLFENKQIIIHDDETIKEFRVFVRSGGSYASEAGHHDDIAMTYILFAWVNSNEMFNSLIDNNEEYIQIETPSAPIQLKNFNQYNSIEEFMRT